MPAAPQQEPPIVAEVDSPIINSPFREPEHYWQIERGKPPVKAEGRRRASYFYRVREEGKEASRTVRRRQGRGSRA